MATANPWLSGAGFDAYRSAGWRYLGLVAVILVLLVEVLVKASGAANKVAAPPPSVASYVNKPVPASLMRSLKTASQAGLGFTKDVTILSATARVSSATGPVKGTPTLYYQGADFCPYCAAERWSIVLTLLRFGTVSNLHYMASNPKDVFPNTPTFTFDGASYTSPYLDFSEAEVINRTDTAELQTPSAANAAAERTYNVSRYVGAAAGNIPFIDVADRYVWVGAPFDPTLLREMRWPGIAKALVTAAKTGKGNSNIQTILYGANLFTAAICSADGGKPAAVCSAPGVLAAKGGLPK